MTSPRIAEICALYADAEASIKRYERIGLDNLMPAVNELRYAGQHLLMAETAENGEEMDKHLSRAARHCERARYDAKESTIVALLEGIATIRSLGFTDTELMAAVPDWTEWLQVACRAQAFIVRAGNVKNASATELDSAIFELMDVREKLCQCEPMIMGMRQKKIDSINAERQAEEDRRVRAQEESQRVQRIEEDRRYVRSVILSWTGLVVGVFGLAASVFGIILALKG